MISSEVSRWHKAKFLAEAKLGARPARGLFGGT
jgi:hypothetical protein